MYIIEHNDSHDIAIMIIVTIINSYNIDKSTCFHTFLAEVEQAKSWPKHPLEAEAYPRVFPGAFL